MLDRKKVRLLRRMNDLTLAEMAEKLGYSTPSAVWRLERYEVDLPLSRLEQIAKVFGVQPEELLLPEPSTEPVTKPGTNTTI